MKNETPIFLRLAAEVAIKSRRTRKRFGEILVRNIRDALDRQGIPHRVRERWNRLEVYSPNRERAVEVLERVFGIGTIVPVERVLEEVSWEQLLEAGLEHFRPLVSGKRFAVRVRRRGKQAFSSQELERELGALLYPFAAGVDLTNPEVTAYIEIEQGRAYFYTRRIPGAGGLPVGSQGRALSLLSGGYDSAVSSWLMLKRGVEVHYVFFNLAGPAYERAVLQVAKVLTDDWSYGYRPQFYAMDFGPVLDELRRHVRPKYWQLILKRLMYRAASALAVCEDFEALITGEALGQVSTQTLKNLRAIEKVTDYPVLRPLLGFDKQEIIARARSIGTAVLSEKVKEYCAIAPSHPVTAARVEAVDDEEARMDLAVLDDAVSRARRIDLVELSAAELVTSYVLVDEIPEGARIIDCQPLRLYREWHHPEAEHMLPWKLMQSFDQLDRDRVYLLYCPVGVQSTHIAEKMQQAGYEAYSYRGGARRMRKMLEKTTSDA